jgi:lactoylglutathione lyase
MTTQFGLIVIRATDVYRIAKFYAAMGCNFVTERHGSGPEHLTTEVNGVVFEIYPVGNQPVTVGVRLGFKVASLTTTVAALEMAGGIVKSPPSDGPWGLRAVLLDPEGHAVEIVQCD